MFLSNRYHSNDLTIICLLYLTICLTSLYQLKHVAPLLLLLSAIFSNWFSPWNPSWCELGCNLFRMQLKKPIVINVTGNTKKAPLNFIQFVQLRQNPSYVFLCLQLLWWSRTSNFVRFLIQESLLTFFFW